MRGRSYAIGTSMTCAIVPLLSWLSTAIVSLVVLRKGALEGALVLLWTLLPLGAILYFFGQPDPSPVTALIGTAIMAYVLRVTVSWELTFAIAIVLSAAGSLVFQYTAADVLVLIVEVYIDYTKQLSVEMTYEAAEKQIVGLYATGKAYAMLALLVLARWWQSQLYNPGGFQKEFHDIRITPILSTALVSLMFVCFVFKDQLGAWLPLLTVPLAVSGIAIVHWIVSYREMSVYWLAFAYLFLLFFLQLAYPMLAALALMDSYLNIRQRVKTKKV